MTLNEVNYLIERNTEKYKDSWEQTRLLCYYIAATQSSKPLKPSEVLPLPWDEKKEQPTINKTELEALKEKALLMENIINQHATKQPI